MSQTSEDLRKAAEILDRRGWCQGAHEAPDGRVCAEAAVIRAVENDRVRLGEVAIRDVSKFEQFVELVPGHVDGALFEQPRVGIRHPVIGYLYKNMITDARVYDAFTVLKQHMPEGEERSVNKYNDDPMTSVEDVKLMFKRAIEAEEAKA